MKKPLAALLLLGALAVGACDDDDDNGTGTGNDGTAQVRVVHLSPDAPNVDVLVDGAVAVADLAYPEATDYLDVPAGDRAVRVEPVGSNDAVITATLALEDGADYTVIAAGTVDEIAAQVLEDDTSAPPAGQIRVRLVHGAPGAGLVDVYVTGPDDDITAADPIAEGFAFGDVSPYVTVPAGTYRVRVTGAGTTDVAIDSGPVTLAAGAVRTILARDAPMGGAPFGAVVLEDRSALSAGRLRRSTGGRSGFILKPERPPVRLEGLPNQRSQDRGVSSCGPDLPCFWRCRSPPPVPAPAHPMRLRAGPSRSASRTRGRCR